MNAEGDYLALPYGRAFCLSYLPLWPGPHPTGPFVFQLSNPCNVASLKNSTNRETDYLELRRSRLTAAHPLTHEMEE